jgi:hypothetical protein
MIGRYVIAIPAQNRPKERQQSWHQFANACRSLRRAGLAYEVQLNLTAQSPHVLITAAGTAYEHLELEVECFYCGSSTRSLFRIGERTFCSKGCGSDYAK